MILTEVRDFIRDRGQVALRDLALHFDMDEEAMRGVIAHWVLKGKVRKLPSGTTCSGCSSCTPETIEIYAWTERSP
jgi:hypothetical protein